MSVLTAAMYDQMATDGTLVRGVQGVYHMLWMMAKGNGMKETKASLKMGAQAMVMLLQLVHYAYALGIRQGKGQ